MSLPYVLVKLIKSQFNLWHDILFARTRTHTHTRLPLTPLFIHSRSTISSKMRNLYQVNIKHSLTFNNSLDTLNFPHM